MYRSLIRSYRNHSPEFLEAMGKYGNLILGMQYFVELYDHIVIDERNGHGPTCTLQSIGGRENIEMVERLFAPYLEELPFLGIFTKELRTKIEAMEEDARTRWPTIEQAREENGLHVNHIAYVWRKEPVEAAQA